MGINHENWLPHLSPEVISETEGNYLDAYVVALEGWRRGLRLRWHVKDSEKFKDMKTWFVEQPGQLFSLQSNERTHYFFRTRGDIVPNEAVEQGMDKQQTKEMLSEANVPIPQGKRFAGDYTENDIVNYASSLGFPIVMKPKDGSFGQGVMSNIKNVEELKLSFQYLRDELKKTDIIVEQHINGKDYRIYVVGDKVVGAILRTPPNVIGDGINTLETLIKQKNTERSMNPRLISCPIRMDDETMKYLNQSNYHLSTIPEEGQVVYMNNKANISLGGDPIDVLDELSSKMKEVAVKALHAIPGLEHGAVDLMIETTPEKEEVGYVIELNPTAQLGGILFPINGQPRDIPSAIIDYYFPETINSLRNTLAYFDFQEVLLPLSRGSAQVTSVTLCDRENISARKLKCTGDFSEISELYTLRSTIINFNLSGSITVHVKSEVEVVVMGKADNIQAFKQHIQVNNNVITTVDSDTLYQRPVKTGVTLNDATDSLIKNIRKLQKQTSAMRINQQQLEKEYNNMLNSNSWKVTAPIRKVTSGMKQLIKRT